MLTVHTAGGKEMLEAAVKGAQRQAKALGARPLIVGVTVLTSNAKEANLGKFSAAACPFGQGVRLGWSGGLC